MAYTEIILSALNHIEVKTVYGNNRYWTSHSADTPVRNERDFRALDVTNIYNTALTHAMSGGIRVPIGQEHGDLQRLEERSHGEAVRDLKTAELPVGYIQHPILSIKGEVQTSSWVRSNLKNIEEARIQAGTAGRGHAWNYHALVVVCRHERPDGEVECVVIETHGGKSRPCISRSLVNRVFNEAKSGTLDIGGEEVVETVSYNPMLVDE